MAAVSATASECSRSLASPCRHTTERSRCASPKVLTNAGLTILTCFASSLPSPACSSKAARTCADDGSGLTEPNAYPTSMDTLALARQLIDIPSTTDDEGAVGT